MMRFLGWTVVAVLTVRGVLMIADPVWWNLVISNIPDAGETLVNRTLFTAANELIIAMFIALSLTTSWNLQSALWMAALLALGHVAVDVSKHVLDQSTRDATSFVYLQNHVVYPLIMAYAMLAWLRLRARESRYLDDGFLY